MQEADKYSFGEAKEEESGKGGPMPEAATRLCARPHAKHDIP